MIRFGIIGTGSIAGHHIKSIQGLEHCRVVALASSSTERAKQAKKKYGIPTYGDYNEMLEKADIQAVIVCTQSGNHLKPTLTAAQAGKHVLVEKPIEISIERGRQMITACQAAGVKLGVIFQNRFSADFQKLKQAVECGKLGNLIAGNAYIKWYRTPAYYENSHWKGTIKGDGGAALINQGIHTIDLLLDIMGDVESVFAKVKTVKHNIEGEDLGIALVTFKNGALGTIEASTAMLPGYPERLEIYGDKGSVILEAGKIIAWNIIGEEAATIEQLSGKTGAADPMAVDYRLHQAQIADFVQAITKNTTPLVNGESGLRSLALISAIYESSKMGKEVK